MADEPQFEAARAVLEPLARDGGLQAGGGGELTLAVTDPATSAQALRALDAHDLRIASLELRRPTLDDVFLALTGRTAERAEEEAA